MTCSLIGGSLEPPSSCSLGIVILRQQTLLHGLTGRRRRIEKLHAAFASQAVPRSLGASSSSSSGVNATPCTGSEVQCSLPVQAKLLFKRSWSVAPPFTPDGHTCTYRDKKSRMAQKARSLKGARPEGFQRCLLQAPGEQGQGHQHRAGHEQRVERHHLWRHLLAHGQVTELCSGQNGAPAGRPRSSLQPQQPLHAVTYSLYLQSDNIVKGVICARGALINADPKQRSHVLRSMLNLFFRHKIKETNVNCVITEYDATCLCSVRHATAAAL